MNNIFIIIITIIIILLIISIIFCIKNKYYKSENFYIQQQPFNDYENDVSHTSYNKNIYPQIDMVYTWVDSSDPIWKTLHSYYSHKHNYKTPKIRYPNEIYPDIELELSLELTLQNAPWIDTIYILTMKPQIPQSLLNNPTLYKEYKNGRIQIIHHDDIGLPITFDSNTIESRLHHIPNLSEHFLYMNDDMYILNPVKKYHFFTQNMKPVYRYHILNTIPIEEMNKRHPNFHEYAHSWNRLQFKFNPVLRNSHGVPFVLTKSLLANAENKYRPDFLKLNETPFRQQDADQILGLSINYAIINGDIVEYSNDPLLKKDTHGRKMIPQLLNNIKHIHTYCLNNPPADSINNSIGLLREQFLNQ